MYVFSQLIRYNHRKLTMQTPEIAPWFMAIPPSFTLSFLNRTSVPPVWFRIIYFLLYTKHPKVEYYPVTLSIYTGE